MNITPNIAKLIGDRIGVNWNEVSLDQFMMGIVVEFEHGTVDLQTNVTNDDLLETGKIALAHLKELPDYYTRLDAMESEGNADSADDLEDPDLIKALNKQGMVQVPTQVKGKTGTFTRNQWKRISDLTPEEVKKYAPELAKESKGASKKQTTKIVEGMIYDTTKEVNGYSLDWDKSIVKDFVSRDKAYKEDKEMAEIYEDGYGEKIKNWVKIAGFDNGDITGETLVIPLDIFESLAVEDVDATNKYIGEPESKGSKPSGNPKSKVEELSKTLGNDKLLTEMKSRGITWKEHPAHRELNIMRAKMALKKHFESGGEWKDSTPPKAKEVPKKKEPKAKDTPKPKETPKKEDTSKTYEKVGDVKRPEDFLKRWSIMQTPKETLDSFLSRNSYTDKIEGIRSLPAGTYIAIVSGGSLCKELEADYVEVGLREISIKSGTKMVSGVKLLGVQGYKSKETPKKEEEKTKETPKAKETPKKEEPKTKETPKAKETLKNYVKVGTARNPGLFAKYNKAGKFPEDAVQDFLSMNGYTDKMEKLITLTGGRGFTAIISGGNLCKEFGADKVELTLKNWEKVVGRQYYSGAKIVRAQGYKAEETPKKAEKQDFEVYRNGKKISLEEAENWIGKEKLNQRVASGRETYDEDPHTEISWMDGLEIKFKKGGR